MMMKMLPVHVDRVDESATKKFKEHNLLDTTEPTQDGRSPMDRMETVIYTTK